MSNPLKKTVAGITYNARQAEAYAPQPSPAPLHPPVMPLNPQPKLFSFSAFPAMGQPPSGTGGRRSRRNKRSVRRSTGKAHHKRKSYHKRKAHHTRK